MRSRMQDTDSASKKIEKVSNPSWLHTKAKVIVVNFDAAMIQKQNHFQLPLWCKNIFQL